MNVKPEIVVAVDSTGGFGKAGKIPWHLPEDMKRFKALTEGHVCVMGRHTYTDILEDRKTRDEKRGITEPITEILRGRETYVISSNENLETPGATRIEGLGTVMSLMHVNHDTRKLFILGGRQVFIQGLSWVDTIHLTLVKGEPYDCDVFFPIDVLNRKFRIVDGTQTDNAYFVTYQRK